MHQKNSRESSGSEYGFEDTSACRLWSNNDLHLTRASTPLPEPQPKYGILITAVLFSLCGRSGSRHQWRLSTHALIAIHARAKWLHPLCKKMVIVGCKLAWGSFFGAEDISVSHLLSPLRALFHSCREPTAARAASHSRSSGHLLYTVGADGCFHLQPVESVCWTGSENKPRRPSSHIAAVSVWFTCSAWGEPWISNKSKWRVK